MKSSKKRRPPISIDFTHTPEWEQLWRSLARAILDEQAKRKDGKLSEEHLMELLRQSYPYMDKVARSIPARGKRQPTTVKAVAMMREKLKAVTDAGMDPQEAWERLPSLMVAHFSALKRGGPLSGDDAYHAATQHHEWKRWRDNDIPMPEK